MSIGRVDANCEVILDVVQGSWASDEKPTGHTSPGTGSPLPSQVVTEAARDDPESSRRGKVISICVTQI